MPTLCAARQAAREESEARRAAAHLALLIRLRGDPAQVRPSGVRHGGSAGAGILRTYAKGFRLLNEEGKGAGLLHDESVFGFLGFHSNDCGVQGEVAAAAAGRETACEQRVQRGAPYSGRVAVRHAGDVVHSRRRADHAVPAQSVTYFLCGSAELTTPYVSSSTLRMSLMMRPGYTATMLPAAAVPRMNTPHPPPSTRLLPTRG